MEILTQSLKNIKKHRLSIISEAAPFEIAKILLL
tara:strand:+ start:321 stop:422 length:102 start_codon:yes stop_codon:yes gene_type:complete